MSPSSEYADQARTATTRVWLLWIAVAATVPVLHSLFYVALQRRFGSHFESQGSLLTLVILVLPAAPAVLQWAVLRRLAPNLSFVIWVGSCWLATIVGAFFWRQLSRWHFNGDTAFDLARLHANFEGGSLASAWLGLVLYTAVVALLFNLVPILLLGRLTRRSSHYFLTATVLGACAAVLLHKIYTGFVHLDVKSLDYPIGYSEAQYPWSRMATALTTVALFGLVQGAVGGYGLIRMFQPSDHAEAAAAKDFGAATAFWVFGLVAAVLVASHGARYATGRSGYEAGFPEIRRMLRTAPEADKSSGKRILSFSRKIPLPMPVRFVVPSPDGRTVLLLTQSQVIPDQSVLRLDVESGVVDPKPLTEGGSARAIAFSPDGRTVSVNLAGNRRGEGDVFLGRIRLFETEGFTEIKDHWGAEPDCALSQQMAFSEDGDSLWVLCDYSRAQPEDLLAVELQIPDLQVVERRPFPVAVAHRNSTSMVRLEATGNGVFVAGYGWEGEAHYLSVLDVTTGQPLLAPRDVAKALPGGPGFGFCGLYLSRDASLVTVAHCALPATFKNNAAAAAGQFRTFDTATGALVADFGRQVPGDIMQWSILFDRLHGLFAGIGTTGASKTGLLVVWDQRTGRELQRIETAAYRSGAFSLDGQWLVLVGRDDGSLSFYRPTP